MIELNLKIHEIFYSIQGESLSVGKPTVFVRTTACNLRCSWCDTRYAYWKGTLMSVDAVIEAVHKHPTRYVCVTGGEPLGQKATVILLKRLVELGKVVSLETNGSFSVENVPVGVIKVVDIKCPESGETEKMDWNNLSRVSNLDQLKFVIASRRDFEWARDLCNVHNLSERCTVLFSPAFGLVEPKELAEWILREATPVTLQIQMHKQIWGETAMGV